MRHCTFIGLMVLGCCSWAMGGRVTLQFDADDLVTSYSMSPYGLGNPADRQQQDFPRILRANNNSLFIATFTHPAASGTNADFDSFVSNNILSIPFFNMFVLDAPHSQTENWGQTITQDADAAPPTATGASGWSPYIFANPYYPSAGSEYKGTLVGWYNDNFTTDRSNDLKRGGNDHAPFTFTMTFDQDLQLGDKVRLWIGFYGLAASGDENPPGANGLDYYAWQGDYTTSPNGLSVRSVHAYEGIVDATVVPLPAAVWAGLIGLSGVLGCRQWMRWRRIGK